MKEDIKSHIFDFNDVNPPHFDKDVNDYFNENDMSNHKRPSVKNDSKTKKKEAYSYVKTLERKVRKSL